MGEVANCNLVLFFNISEEGPLVIHAEREDAVLVRDSEGGAVDCAVLGPGRRLQVETVEGRKHSELELHGIVVWDFKWRIVVVLVFGKLDVECLERKLANLPDIVTLRYIPHRS